MKTLVIGYGNELRQDDGVGPRAALLMARLGLQAMAVHQLTPELVERISQVEQVVFVDAGMDATSSSSTSRRTGSPDEVVVGTAGDQFGAATQQPVGQSLGVGCHGLCVGSEFLRTGLGKRHRFGSNHMAKRSAEYEGAAAVDRIRVLLGRQNEAAARTAQ